MKTLLFYERGNYTENIRYESTESGSNLSCYSQPERHRIPFWANYIHDLESIWWISVWVLYRFRKATEKRRVLTKVSEDHSCKLFLKPDSPLPRLTFLTLNNSFKNYIENIPHPLYNLKKFVVECRQKLLSAYETIESSMKVNLPIYMTDGGMLHREIVGLLQAARSNDDDEIVLITKKAKNKAGITEYKHDIPKTRESEDLRKKRQQQ